MIRADIPATNAGKAKVEPASRCDVNLVIPHRGVPLLRLLKTSLHLAIYIACPTLPDVHLVVFPGRAIGKVCHAAKPSVWIGRRA